MSYGLKVKDSEGHTAQITPLISCIVSSGIYTSPTTLNADNTYGFDIDLPGTSPIPLSNLAVISDPSPSWGYHATLFSINFGAGGYSEDYYASSTYYVYTMNSTTFLMTSWISEAMTYGNPNTWNRLLTVFPYCTWLPTFSSTGLYTSVRIFPAVGNVIYDWSASSQILGWSLYGVSDLSIGVSSSTVSVIIKNWDY